MKRPDLHKAPATVVEYVEYLESRLSKFDGKSMAKMYAALDKQLGKLADIVNELKMDGETLLDKDDKSFERLIKVAVESKSISENLSFLEQNLGIKEEAEKDATAINPMENRVKHGKSILQEGSGSD